MSKFAGAITAREHATLEGSLGGSLDNQLVPEWLLSYIHTLACTEVEKDFRLAYRTLQPSAMYAIAVLISEWILHITGTSIQSLDEIIEVWSACGKHFDAVQLKKNWINALQVTNIVSTVLPNTARSETEKEDAKELLSEIHQLRDEQRIARVEDSNKEPEIEPEILPKDILTTKSYSRFAKQVDEELYFAPTPDRNFHFDKWLEWTKNRWKYRKLLKQLQDKDARDKERTLQILSQMEQKVKEKEEVRKQRKEHKRRMLEEEAIRRGTQKQKELSAYDKAKQRALLKLQRRQERENQVKQKKRESLQQLIKKRRRSPEPTKQRKHQKTVHLPD